MFDTANYTLNLMTPILLIIVTFNFFTFLMTLHPSVRQPYRCFALYIFLSWVYSAGYLMQVQALPLELKVIWANVKVTAMCFTPLAWLWATYLTIYRRRLPLWATAALAAVAVLNIVVLWNDGEWQTYRHIVELVKVSENLYLMKPIFGVWFYTIYAWSLYVPMIASAILLFRAFTTAIKTAKVPYGILLAVIITGLSGGLPIRMNLVIVDTHAFTTLLMSLFHLILISKYKFVDVTPLVKDTVMDIIRATVLIYDSKGKLMDHNIHEQDSPFNDLLDLSLQKVCARFGLDPANNDFLDKTATVTLMEGEAKRWFSVLIKKVLEGETEVCGFLVCIKDVTEQNMLLTIDNEKAKLDQKKIIIGDIHDGISSSLTVIGMLAGQVHEDKAAATETLCKINDITSDTLKEIRLMMNSYENEDMSLRDISTDIRYLGNLFVEGSNFIYSHTDDIQGFEKIIIPFKTYINIIRFYKECIVNSIKHSGGDRITSSIRFNGKTLSIAVADNGKGISGNRQNGRGFSSITRRMEDINGKIGFESRNGASVTATIPIRQTTHPDEPASRP